MQLWGGHEIGIRKPEMRMRSNSVSAVFAIYETASTISFMQGNTPKTMVSPDLYFQFERTKL